MRRSQDSGTWKSQVGQRREADQEETTNEDDSWSIRRGQSKQTRSSAERGILEVYGWELTCCLTGQRHYG